jgi:MFS family permease
VVGGLAAGALGLRAIFWAGGALLVLAALPVVLTVREAAVVRRDGSRAAASEILRRAAPGTLAAVAALILCQGLVQTAYMGFQPLVVLRLLDKLGSGTASVTGLAFGASGLASALAAVGYARFARRYGYRLVALTAAVLMAAAELMTAYGPSVAAMVGGTAVAGLFYGAIAPAVSSMIGLETPAEAQARVFGVSSSATAIGFALGPFGGGVLASQIGPSGAIAVCAGGAVLLAAVLSLRVREPRR